MLQNNNKYKVLKQFFNQPTTELHLRQISRQTKIAPPSTKKYLQQLEKEQLITKTHKGIYPTYKANRDNQEFKNIKKWTLAIELQELTNYITNKTNPDAIILYGSASRGEDTETSDIDIAILSEETKLDLKKYEQHRKISPHFIQFNKLSNELKNNIINGIILYGYVKVY